MPVIITVEEVKDGFATTTPDSEIQLYIDMVDGADACLDANDIPDDTQRALKIMAVRSILYPLSNGGRGSVTSETAPSGASRSYGRWSGSTSNPYLDSLKMLDATRCVYSVIDSSNRAYISVVGGRACRK